MGLALVLISAVVIFYIVLSVGQLLSYRRDNTFNVYMHIMDYWRENAYVAPDETILCKLFLGDLLVMYPSYNSKEYEVNEGKFSLKEFQTLKKEFQAHSFPVSMPESNKHYFIVHMPQKRPAN